MGAGPVGLKTVLLASVLALAAPLAAQAAPAEHEPPVAHKAPIHHVYVHRTAYHSVAVHRATEHRVAHSEPAHRPYVHAALAHEMYNRHLVSHPLVRRAIAMHHWIARRGGLSCVPFARSDSGIDLKGNAWQWWGHAAGVYARGSEPQNGAVLAFKANPHMRLGHVAVVSRVVNRREIEIDQANWWGPGMRGGVARNVPVVDVSEANDWSAVRVGLGYSGGFGSVYPTYGFIYDRPDTGVIEASVAAPAPQPALSPAPRDLRPAVERPWKTYEEVAEAPATPFGKIPALQPVNPAGLLGALDRK
ncbi:MAG TPA: CHAP domain-containing protein [Acetobacteraceae bacterium]